MDLSQFLSEVTTWTQNEADVRAAALVGSHARGTASPASDIDLILLVRDPVLFWREPGWTGRFGRVLRTRIEDYGRVTSVRVWYADGREVEYGLTDSSWTSLPLDEGTRRTVADGMRILYEEGDLLSRCLGASPPAVSPQPSSR